jgi:uncharacterized protein YaaN involved in tellurite resistance
MPLVKGKPVGILSASEGVLMSERNPPVGGPKKDIKETLDSILNFGPEDANSTSNFSERIKEIVRKLQEINRRIDNLSSRF